MPFNPLISVVIATRNRAGLLRKSIASIQSQSLQNFEMILVDDASQDETQNLIPGLSQEDPRIRYYRSESNLGPGAARNWGIQHARGDLIAILDDDDIALPERLEVQSSILQSDPEIALVFSAVDWIDGDGSEIGNFPGIVLRGEFPADPSEVFKLLYLQGNKIPNTTIMARKEILLEFPYPTNLWVGEDWLMVMRLAASGYRFNAIQDRLVRMLRESDHQSLMKRTDYVTRAQYQVLQIMKAWLLEQEIHTFDAIHREAYANQVVREARVRSGIAGLLLDMKALILDPENISARQTLRWLLRKAGRRGIGLVKKNRT